MAGTHAGGRRGDALAHAFGVDRERRCVLEDARARRFRHLRQPERIVERMDVKRARQVQGVEVVVGLEHLAHALGRPALDLGPEFLAIELHIRQDLIAVVDLGDFEPAGNRRDTGHPRLGNRGAHVAQPHLRQVPQRLGVLHADAADHALHRLRKSRQNETVVAAGRVPGDAAGLQHRHRPPAPRELARGGQPGKAGADDADVDVEIEGQRPAHGRRHHGRRVPGGRVGCRLGRVHVFFLGNQAAIRIMLVRWI